MRSESPSARARSTWAADRSGSATSRTRTITRIDPATRTATKTIPLDGRTPTGIDFGADALWVAHGALGQRLAVDPQFGEASAPIAVAGEALGSRNGAVAVGEGAVWAVYGDSTLARVDPDTAEVTGSTFVDGSAPAGIAVAAGDLWIVNTDSSDVRRYNPDTFTEGEVGRIHVGRGPTAIAAGAGAVWVANTGDDNVTRIDPGTSAAPPIRVGDEPVSVAVGGGAVWVANAGDGTVSRIDPATSEVVETIETGNAPSGIAFGSGLVWVSVQSP